MEYQIGDFSRISRLSIKTLRYYHECGLVEPSRIDGDSGYRYYDGKALERVKVINELKELDFSLKEIKDILDQCSDDEDIRGYIIEKSREVNEKIRKYAEVQRKLEAFIKQAENEEELKMLNKNYEIVIKDVPDILAAALRFKGRYQDIGKYYGRIFKQGGRYSAGAPFALYYDKEFKEEDADMEACVPVKKAVEGDGVKSRTLKGGKALTIIHHGPYETLGESYKALFDYANENRIQVKSPSREVYIKGPGMILPRSPKRFITEIQMLTE